MTNIWEAGRDVLAKKSNENLTDSTEFSSYAYDVNATFQRIGVQQSGTAFDATDGSSVVTETLDWSYDALGQVIAENHSDDGRDNAYEFDSIGNRRRAVHGSLTLPPNPNYGANEVNQLTLTPFPTAPSYDDDGNMLTGSVLGSYDRPLGSLVAYTNAKWDGNNRLRQVEIDGEMVTFDYDYRGRRIEASDGTGVGVGLSDTDMEIARKGKNRSLLNRGRIVPEGHEFPPNIGIGATFQNPDGEVVTDLYNPNNGGRGTFPFEQ